MKIKHGARSVLKDGIILFENLYRHPKLDDYRGKSVGVVYQDSDLNQIDCYTLAGEFICQAKLKPRYRPSNGTEGECFMTKFCDKCKRDDKPMGCEIKAYTMLYDLDDPMYPKEWTYDVNGSPCCERFTPGGKLAKYPSLPQHRHGKSQAAQLSLF